MGAAHRRVRAGRDAGLERARSSTGQMPRKFLRKYIPHHETVRDSEHLRWARPLLKHPNLWHLNRHSVAGGLAVGLLGGMIPGPVQILTATLLAILFHVNLPVAIAATLLTNPLTWPFLIVAAYAIGSLITGQENGTVIEFRFDWLNGDWSQLLPQLWHWFMGLGETFLIGNLILAVLLAAVGYGVVQLGWRLHVRAYLKRRRQRPKPAAPKPQRD